jgi:Zinc knuckle
VKKLIETKVRECLEEIERKRNRQPWVRKYRESLRSEGQVIESVCYNCGQPGHIAKGCRSSKKREKEVNKENFQYSDLYEIDGKKRRRLNLQILMKEYAEVIYDEKEQERIKFCPIEKCRIDTKEGARVVKRGINIPQSLKLKLEEHLERRGIIRKSKSQWRNPVRAIQKPDGEVRLVSNLMKLNDLAEKDSYSLPDMRKVIQATQGANFLTVIDLKDAYYHVEIAQRKNCI